MLFTLILLISFTCVWFAINHCLSLFNFEITKTRQQRDFLCAALLCFVSSLFVVVYFAFFGSIFDYETLLRPVCNYALHFFAAFYIFGIINHLRIVKKMDKLHIFHHLVILSLTLFIILLNLPEMYAFLYIILVPGVPYFYYHAYKLKKNYNRQFAEWLYLMNGWLWFIFRIVVQTAFLILALNYELKGINPDTEKYRFALFFGYVMLTFFSLYWMYEILRYYALKRKRRHLAVLRAQRKNAMQ